MVLEGHYLETVEGLFFAVKGSVHPPNRTIACLRYVPWRGASERQKGNTGYRRLYDWVDQERFLEESYPQYLAPDPVFHRIVQSVPRESVHRIYSPHERLEELRASARNDALQEDAVAFASILQEEAGIEWRSLGISGSLLIGLHTPRSDLDLVVYGSENSRAVHRTLLALRAAGGPVEALGERELAALYQERGASAFATPEAYALRERAKAMQGCFRGRPYFIRFLKAPEELDERYGDRIYTPLGQATIEATVVDARESLFTPCCYRVNRVRVLEGPAVEALTEIVSYRGRFCEQAREGERVRAAGTLERVESTRGKVWHRLLLGNHGGDFLLPEDER
jgi:predicted nucleotidyltransferase